MATTTLDADLEQVTPDQIKHFDRDAFSLVADYHIAGWRSHLTTQGHVFLKAPDGTETASVSRDSLRGRSGRNAAAPLKRWLRRIDEERREREDAARKGAGAAFGIANLAKAQYEDPFHDVPPRVSTQIRDSDEMIAYVTARKERFSKTAKDPFNETLQIGIDFDKDPALRAWTVVDTAEKRLVAHGPGLTRNEALTMLRTEGKLPPATDEELMAEADGNTCPQCGFEAKRSSALQLHIKAKHTGFVCPECGTNAGFSGRALASHREKRHGVIPTHRLLMAKRAEAAAEREPKPEPKARRQQCPTCKIMFDSPQARANHERAAHHKDLSGMLVSMMRAMDRPVMPVDVRSGLGIDEGAAKGLLGRMSRKGQLVRVRHGVYRLPEPGDVPVTAPDVTSEADDRDVPMTSQDVPVTSPPSPPSQDVPAVENAHDMVAAIRRIVAAPTEAELEQLRTERDKLLTENRVLGRKVEEMQARMDLMKEALGA